MSNAVRFMVKLYPGLIIYFFLTITIAITCELWFFVMFTNGLLYLADVDYKDTRQSNHNNAIGSFKDISKLNLNINDSIDEDVLLT